MQNASMLQAPHSLATIGRQQHGMTIGEDARCFAFNADSALLVKLLSLASSGGGGEDRQA
jgi:hypothetical protein